MKKILATILTLCMIATLVPTFTAMGDCVKNGCDAYAGGAKYNNTSINAFGLAEAVDSIVAVRKLVFN